MQYLGEIISLGVAFSWTIAAMSCEVASKRLGIVVTNVWRMGLALLLSLLMMWWFTGEAFPVHAHFESWVWLLLSGVVGYFFGDWCLFNSYISIGSRYGQLFMTLAPMFTAISAWAMMGQVMSLNSVIAMVVTMSGIAISVLSKGDGKHKVSLQLPLKGVLFGIGAGLGQGLGYVLSLIGQEYYRADVQAAVSAEAWEGHGELYVVQCQPHSLHRRSGLLWHLADSQGRRQTLGAECAQQKRHVGFAHSRVLRTVPRCELLADGGSLYRCRHSKYADGHESYHDSVAILLSVP